MIINQLNSKNERDYREVLDGSEVGYTDCCVQWLVRIIYN